MSCNRIRVALKLKEDYKKYEEKWEAFCSLPHEGFVSIPLGKGIEYEINPYGVVREKGTKVQLERILAGTSYKSCILTLENKVLPTVSLSKLLALAFCEGVNLNSRINVEKTDDLTPDNLFISPNKISALRFKTSFYCGIPTPKEEKDYKWIGCWNKSPYYKNPLPVPGAEDLFITPSGVVKGKNKHLTQFISKETLVGLTYCAIDFNAEKEIIIKRYEQLPLTPDNVTKVPLEALNGRHYNYLTTSRYRFHGESDKDYNKRTKKKMVEFPKQEPVKWWK